MSVQGPASPNGSWFEPSKGSNSAEATVGDAAADLPYAAGGMFWLMWKKFVGSYLRLIDATRG
jgi:hypothetical protein